MAWCLVKYRDNFTFTFTFYIYSILMAVELPLSTRFTWFSESIQKNTRLSSSSSNTLPSQHLLQYFYIIRSHTIFAVESTSLNNLMIGLYLCSGLFLAMSGVIFAVG